jgi:hypothetical protein
MKSSPYMKSISAQFDPKNKAEKKGKLGRPSKPAPNVPVKAAPSVAMNFGR